VSGSLHLRGTNILPSLSTAALLGRGALYFARYGTYLTVSKRRFWIGFAHVKCHINWRWWS